MKDPPELRSQHGVLEVTLHFRYEPTLTGQGPPRYCYVTDQGQEAPTLRVHPGDRLIIHLQNDLLAQPKAASAHEPSATAGGDCQPGPMSAAVTNLHFHGLNIPPTCHQDDVVRTIIQPGETFDYRITIPRDEPPGLYWYHPHPHGYSERQVQGGASGALIVEGIEQRDRALARMPQRVIVLRDQTRSDFQSLSERAPAWDLSINYIPVTYPLYQPATIETAASRKEFWRVVNAGANTILDLQLLLAGEPQPLQLIALDGVPVRGRAVKPIDVVLPPGARAEFVVHTPKAGQQAQLVTRRWDTGPEGDADPARPIANLVADNHATEPGRPSASSQAENDDHGRRKVGGPVVERRLYFSQMTPNALEPDASIFYFITVLGQQPAAYRMNQPPNIVLHEGDVEDWVVENRAREDHVFHIHQLHFQLLAVDGKPAADGAMRDTINLPHWSGAGPYPSVKLRLDFRDPKIVGTFLYHCHILKHEDMGMMGVIEVLPPGIPTTTTLTTPALKIDVATDVTVTASVRAKAAEAVPGGTVQFAVDGINAGRPVVLEQGRAAFQTSFEESGEHVITATYSGDTAHDESLSAIKIKVSGSY